MEKITLYNPDKTSFEYLKIIKKEKNGIDVSYKYTYVEKKEIFSICFIDRIKDISIEKDFKVKYNQDRNKITKTLLKITSKKDFINYLSVEKKAKYFLHCLYNDLINYGIIDF